MRTLTIKGERGTKEITKTVRVRKEIEDGFIVEWGNGNIVDGTKKIGKLSGADGIYKLTTQSGTRFMTVMTYCEIV